MWWLLTTIVNVPLFCFRQKLTYGSLFLDFNSCSKNMGKDIGNDFTKVTYKYWFDLILRSKLKMMMMMMNCFFGMADRQKASNIISSGGYCQRFLPSQTSGSQTSGTRRVEFEPARSLRFFKRSCTVVITTTPLFWKRWHNFVFCNLIRSKAGQS